MTRERWMASCFLAGSVCFVIGPLPGYANLVGDQVDSVTFFAGSLLFTAGGTLQVWLAAAERRVSTAGRAAWWAALIQSAGTLLFNASTFRAMSTALSSSEFDKLVWRPDALGSVCFLVSGVIAYRASARRGWLPTRGRAGWWEPSVNLAGCILFGISAIAGHVVPTTGSVIDQAASNWTTVLGAGCFLACALATVCTGRTSKSPRLERLRRLVEVVDRDAEELVAGRRQAASG